MRQYQGPRGSFDHPASALTLRLALAIFGLVTCGVLAVVAWRVGSIAATVVAAVLAAAALVDIVVIQRRRHPRP